MSGPGTDPGPPGRRPLDRGGLARSKRRQRRDAIGLHRLGLDRARCSTGSRLDPGLGLDRLGLDAASGSTGSGSTGSASTGSGSTRLGRRARARRRARSAATASAGSALAPPAAGQATTGGGPLSRSRRGALDARCLVTGLSFRLGVGVGVARLGVALVGRPSRSLGRVSGSTRRRRRRSRPHRVQQLLRRPAWVGGRLDRGGRRRVRRRRRRSRPAGPSAGRPDCAAGAPESMSGSRARPARPARWPPARHRRHPGRASGVEGRGRRPHVPATRRSRPPRWRLRPRGVRRVLAERAGASGDGAIPPARTEFSPVKRGEPKARLRESSDTSGWVNRNTTTRSSNVDKPERERETTHVADGEVVQHRRGDERDRVGGQDRAPGPGPRPRHGDAQGPAAVHLVLEPFEQHDEGVRGDTHRHDETGDTGQGQGEADLAARG